MLGVCYTCSPTVPAVAGAPLGWCGGGGGGIRIRGGAGGTGAGGDGDGRGRGVVMVDCGLGSQAGLARRVGDVG